MMPDFSENKMYTITNFIYTIYVKCTSKKQSEKSIFIPQNALRNSLQVTPEKWQL